MHYLFFQEKASKKETGNETKGEQAELKLNGP